jgi:hypothetical protein
MNLMEVKMYDFNRNARITYPISFNYSLGIVGEKRGRIQKSFMVDPLLIE